VTLGSTTLHLPASRDIRDAAPAIVAGAAFVVLFAQPIRLLAIDWWTNPEAGHGLLLGPLAFVLAWRTGLSPDRRAQVGMGTAILIAAVLLRFASGLAAELFTMRMSMVLAAAGLVVFYAGLGQLRMWWLPFCLFALSIPLPAVVVNALALPLQFKASQMGAALLKLRQVPVQLSGNIIDLPGRRLFVTEACSGLRSLTALISLGVLTAGLWLRHPAARVLLIALAIPIAIGINVVRVFLTGFLVFFVDPKLGDGFMHITEGWLMFVLAFGLLCLAAWLLGKVEARTSVTVDV